MHALNGISSWYKINELHVDICLSTNVGLISHKIWKCLPVHLCSIIQTYSKVNTTIQTPRTPDFKLTSQESQNEGVIIARALAKSSSAFVMPIVAARWRCCSFCCCYCFSDRLCGFCIMWVNYIIILHAHTQALATWHENRTLSVTGGGFSSSPVLD